MVVATNAVNGGACNGCCEGGGRAQQPRSEHREKAAARVRLRYIGCHEEASYLAVDANLPSANDDVSDASVPGRPLATLDCVGQTIPNLHHDSQFLAYHGGSSGSKLIPANT